MRAELKDRAAGRAVRPTYATARTRLGTLVADRGRYDGLSRPRHDTIGALERSFELYMTHHHLNGMPADANITENVIKQLGKKLRLMEGFASLQSAERFSRLLIACYRFKRFTDSCRSATTTASHPSNSPASTPSPQTGSTTPATTTHSNTQLDALQPCLGGVGRPGRSDRPRRLRGRVSLRVNPSKRSCASTRRLETSRYTFGMRPSFARA